MGLIPVFIFALLIGEPGEKTEPANPLQQSKEPQRERESFITACEMMWGRGLVSQPGSCILETNVKLGQAKLHDRSRGVNQLQACGPTIELNQDVDLAVCLGL